MPVDATCRPRILRQAAQGPRPLDCSGVGGVGRAHRSVKGAGAPSVIGWCGRNFGRGPRYAQITASRR
jgi:hypothetical protein